VDQDVGLGFAEGMVMVPEEGDSREIGMGCYATSVEGRRDTWLLVTRQ
jgi:hypothetical protein